MQNGAGSVISGNKVFQLQGRRDGPPAYNYVAVLFDRSENFAQVSVVGNIVRGDNGSAGVGLAYIAGSTNRSNATATTSGSGHGGGGDAEVAGRSLCDLRVLSSENHVQLVQQPRRVDPGVTLESGL